MVAEVDPSEAIEGTLVTRVMVSSVLPTVTVVVPLAVPDVAVTVITVPVAAEPAAKVAVAVPVASVVA